MTTSGQIITEEEALFVYRDVHQRLAENARLNTLNTFESLAQIAKLAETLEYLKSHFPEAYLRAYEERLRTSGVPQETIKSEVDWMRNQLGLSKANRTERQ